MGMVACDKWQWVAVPPAQALAWDKIVYSIHILCSLKEEDQRKLLVRHFSRVQMVLRPAILRLLSRPPLLLKLDTLFQWLRLYPISTGMLQPPTSDSPGVGRQTAYRCVGINGVQVAGHRLCPTYQQASEGRY